MKLVTSAISSGIMVKSHTSSVTLVTLVTDGNFRNGCYEKRYKAKPLLFMPIYIAVTIPPYTPLIRNPSPPQGFINVN